MSNKLLLAWFTLLLVVPMGYICLYANKHYDKMNSHDFDKKYGKIYASRLTENSVGLLALKTPPFKKIILHGASDDAQYLYYVNGGEEYGLKIQTALKGIVKTQMDKDGNLDVSFSKPLHLPAKTQVKIMVYCPTPSALVFDHLSSGSVIMLGKDSINMEVSHTLENVNLSISRMNFDFSSGKRNGKKLDLLQVNLEHARIYLGIDNIHRLELHADHRSFGGLINNHTDSLSLYLNDQSIFMLNNGIISNVSGYISPDSYVKGLDRSRIHP